MEYISKGMGYSQMMQHNRKTAILGSITHAHRHTQQYSTSSYALMHSGSTWKYMHMLAVV